MREDGNVEFRSLNKDDYKILGKDKQIGKTVRNNGIVVSDSFKVRFDAGEVTRTYDELHKFAEDWLKANPISNAVETSINF